MSTSTTVAQLIEMLGKLPQDYPVYLEGCDCINLATQPKVDSESVLIGADVFGSEVWRKPDETPV